MRLALTILAAAGFVFFLSYVVPAAVAWAGPSNQCCL
jgi:hypothetical protein